MSTFLTLDDPKILERDRLAAIEVAKRKGINPEHALIERTDDGRNVIIDSRKEGAGNIETLVTQALASVAPNIAGTASAAGIGLATKNPYAMLGGAVAGGGATALGQDKLVENIAPEQYRKLLIQRTARPVLSTLGGIGGGFGLAANTLRPFLGQGARQALTKAGQAAGLSAGIEGVSQQVFEGELDPARIGLAAAAGPFQIRSHGLGKKAEELGEGLARRIAPGRIGVSPVTASPDPYSVYRSISEANNTNVQDPAVWQQFAEQIGQPGLTREQMVAQAEMINRRNKKAADSNKPPAQNIEELPTGKRLSDEEVDVLLRAESKPPSSTPLDNAIFDGKKEGIVRSTADVRRIEDGVLQGIEPKQVLRDLWMEKQQTPQVRAQESASVLNKAVDDRITKYQKELAKLDNSLKAAVTARKKIMDDPTLGEDIKASQAEAFRNTYNNITQRKTAIVNELNAVQGVEPQPQGLLGAGDAPVRYGGVDPALVTKALSGEAPKTTPGRQITPEMDAAYMQAVESGDTATAQRMVDEAAKAAGYNEPVKHATPFTFNEFKRAMISHSDPDTNIRGFHVGSVADEYSAYTSGMQNRGPAGKIKVLNLRTKLGKEIDRNQAQRMVQKGEEIDGFPKGYDTTVFQRPPIWSPELQAAFNLGKDIPTAGGVLRRGEGGQAELWNESVGGFVTAYTDLQGALDPQASGGTHYAIRNPEQLKSADAVTRDASGNIIPLSKRFDPSNPNIYYSGLNPAVAKEAAKLLLKPIDPFVQFLKTGRIAGRQLWSGTQSLLDQMRKLGKEGSYLADKDFDLHRDANAIFNTAANKYNAAFKGLSKEENGRVSRYLNEMQDIGQTLIQPSAREQSAINEIRSAILAMRVQQNILGLQVSSGPGFTREGNFDPNYIPQMIHPKVAKIIMGNKIDHPQYNALKQEFLTDWMNKTGETLEQATKAFNEIRAAGNTLDPKDSAKFGAVIKAEGHGLPPSWRAPLRDSLYWHAYKTGKNLAWFKHVQNDPIAAKIVGETDDGKGGVIDYNQPVNAGYTEALANNDYIKTWLTEFNSHKYFRPDILDRAVQINNSLMLGPKTGLRDFISTAGHLMDIVPAEDLDKVGKALSNLVFGSDIKGRMEKGGTVRAMMPFEFVTPDDMSSWVSKFTDLMRTVQGRNLAEAGARQFAYETGSLIGRSQLQRGKLGFFKDMGLKGYQSMTPDELADAVGAKFVELTQGNYRGSGLPRWLLNTGQNPGVRQLLSLSRWSVERFNNWHSKAWTPAVEKGEFGPLLRGVLGNLATAGLVKTLEETLFDAKPPEMSWKEWMKADNKETAYTLFSKLQLSGYAGILSDLVFSPIQLMAGELPRNVENPTIMAAAQIATRVRQMADAVSRGEPVTEAFGEFVTTTLSDRMQTAKIIGNMLRDKDEFTREKRMYDRQTGNKNISWAQFMNNPMAPGREFRDARNVEDAKKALPSMERAVAGGSPMQVQSPLKPLMRDPMNPSRPPFYEWLAGLQGPEAAQQALDQDAEGAQLTLLKRQAVQQAQLQRALQQTLRQAP